MRQIQACQTHALPQLCRQLAREKITAQLEDLQAAQLLTIPEEQKLFQTLSTALLELQSHAEKQELWGELNTEDDKNTNRQVKDILLNITRCCRTECTTLNFLSAHDVPPLRKYSNASGG